MSVSHAQIFCWGPVSCVSSCDVNLSPVPPPPHIHVQFYHRALERGSGASLCHRALLVADLLLPWLTTLVWVRPVVSLPVFGRLFAGHGLEGAARAAAMASWGVRVWVTAATAGLRLAVGRRQLQMFLDGVKEAVLQDLREKKVRFLVPVGGVEYPLFYGSTRYFTVGYLPAYLRTYVRILSSGLKTVVI